MTHCIPVVNRVQRFVSINGLLGTSLLDVEEEVILTFRCDHDADIICFQRVKLYKERDERTGEERKAERGTYLAEPNGGYALIENVVDPEGRVLSILPSHEVENLKIASPGEGNKYVCLEMEVKGNRFYTVAFRLRKHVPHVSIGSLMGTIMPYYDAIFTDYITSINAGEGQAQTQYVQVLLNNEHLRFNEKYVNDALKRFFREVGMEKEELHRLYIPADKKITYSFKIAGGARVINVYYRLTLSNFYKYMLWLMVISILGLIALSLLMDARFIGPGLALPVITTLALILISGYITIPKESLIKYRGITILTMIAILVLITSILTI